MALAWGHWNWDGSNLPRGVNLWNPQFATDQASLRQLVELQKAPKNPVSEHEFSDDVDLLHAANTTVLYANETGGHWYRTGKAITLAELLSKLGQRCTVSDIMFWYCHAPKLVKKRRHAWASADRKEAALLRYETFGHYGHRRN